jgi:hypothetical protein
MLLLLLCMRSKFCPSCGRYRITYDYCNFCGYNSLVSRSGLILERDERILFVCRVLEGHAQAPLKRGKGLRGYRRKCSHLYWWVNFGNS